MIFDRLRTAHNLRYNINFYLSGIIVLYFNFWLFFKIIGKPLLTFNWIQSELLHLFTCVVLSLPFFFLKRRKIYYFHLIFGINFYLLCSLIYYRTYYTIIPMSSFTMVGNLKGLSDIILSSVRWVDSLFLLPSVLLYVFYIVYVQKRIVAAPFRLRMKLFALLFLLSSSLISYNLITTRHNALSPLSKKSLFDYDIVSATWNYGFLYCWAWQLHDWTRVDNTLTPEDHRAIDRWYRYRHYQEDVSRENTPVTDNVILVIVESLESFPIDKKVDSVEITPCLNALIKNKDTFFAPFVFPQIKDGRSSDCQLIVNSGLLPIHSGATCFRFPNNVFCTLPNALRCRGYSTHTMVGGDPSYWNQAILSRNMGYQDLTSINQYKVDEFFNFGLTDSSFFAQSVEKLQHFRQPYMAQMVTLSSHAPFNLPHDRVCLKLKHNCAPELAKYLNAIHYTDRCLGMFIDQLRAKGMLNHTRLIITGDHGAFDHHDYLNDYYGKHLLPPRSFVPLIVVNSSATGSYRRVMGQVDIYPTLLDLFHLNGYPWHGMGRSIFDAKKKAIAIDQTLHVVGEAQKCTSQELLIAKDAWRISDLIIRENYFLRRNTCGKVHPVH